MSSVRVNISRLDLFKINVWASAKHISTWILLGISIAAVGALHIFRNGLAAVMNHWDVWLPVSFGAGIGVWLVLMLMGFVCLLLTTRDDDGILGEHIYAITEAGLTESTAANETLIRWGGARWLIKSASGIYIHVTGSVTHVIPKSAFESDEAYETFWRGLGPLARRDA